MKGVVLLKTNTGDGENDSRDLLELSTKVDAFIKVAASLAFLDKIS